MHDQHMLAASPAGSVMLDIGGDVGALVLYVPAAELGREIEVSPDGSTSSAESPRRRTHAAVRERRLDDGSLYCVVYERLTAGEYTIWADETTPSGTATVTGGCVTELDWTSP
jgi:hypothetical protein